MLDRTPVIIGAYVRCAAPDHPAGAEWSLHDTLSALAARGHTCQVVSELGSLRGAHSGVGVYSQPTEDETASHFLNCDVMLTQLDAGMQAQLYASAYRTPLVHLVHSASQLDNKVMPGCAALVVHNTQHVAEACDWWPGESMILHPVVNPARVLVEPNGQAVTLVNVSHAKGGAALLRLAEALPSRVFIGVMGAYGEQVFGQAGVPGHGDNPLPAQLPANLGVSMPTPDIRPVLAASRVVLLLSRTETYGRVAHEALLSGIPVIAHPTPGVIECCASAAAYVEAGATRELALIVERAFTPAWGEWHHAAQARGVYLRERTDAELARLEDRLYRITHDQPQMTLTMEPHHA